MNQIVETNIVDDFDNRPLKKANCSESTVPDEPLPSPPSPTNSTLSPVSELYNEETVLEDSERTFSAEQPDEPKPTNSALSPVSQLNNEETILEDGENKTFSAEQPDKPKHIINNVIYEYLPQGNFLLFTYIMYVYLFNIYFLHLFLFADNTITRDDECAHDVILFSSEEEILVKIEDVSVKQRYLVCLLDKDKWLDDEVSTPF
jgi:hypothetical protein